MEPVPLHAHQRVRYRVALIDGDRQPTQLLSDWLPADLEQARRLLDTFRAEFPQAVLLEYNSVVRVLS